jgi:hypothetical protein
MKTFKADTPMASLDKVLGFIFEKNLKAHRKKIPVL